MLIHLKENRDFTVVVTNTPKSDVVSVSVRCNACNARIQLSKRNKIYPVSNWTRHMKACQKLHKKEGNKKQTLATFWSPKPATSSSDSISDMLQECHASSSFTDVPVPNLDNVISNDSLLSEIDIVEDTSPHKQSEVSSDHNTPSLQIATQWIMIGHTVLYESDRAVLLNEEGWINDNHVASAQILRKEQFPHLGGLDFTLKQETKSLKPLLPNSLQVIHDDGNHWAAASTVNCKREDMTHYTAV